MAMYAGEVFSHELAGGGGWGDPLEREPGQVLRDVRNELVSPERAREDYGVIVDTESWTVDLAGTEALRSKLRASRIGDAPAVLWEDWPRASQAAQ
jgi:N-methylhydantoinase B